MLEEGWAKAIFLAAGLYLAWTFHYVLFLVFAAVLISVSLTSLINYIRTLTRLPRFASTGIAFLLVLAGIAGLSWSGIPFIAAQYEQFIAVAPNAIEQLQELLVSLGVSVPQKLFNLSSYELFEIQSLAAASSTISSTLGVVIDTIFAVILGVYFSTDPGTYRSILATVMPETTTDRLYSVLQNWILGRLASMATVFVLTTLGLRLLGVPFPYFLGLVAGLLSFIPNLGPLLAFIPTAAAAALDDIGLVLSVMILYMAVQAVESYLITPQIERYTVEMPPGVNLAAQVVLGTLFGFLGLLFAVPIVLISREWYNHYRNAS